MIPGMIRCSAVQLRQSESGANRADFTYFNAAVGRIAKPQLSLEGRAREPFLTWMFGRIIAVRNDHALVAWDPETGETAVLVTHLAPPLIALRTDADRELILYCAGYREQAVGVVQRHPHGWTHHRVAYSGAPIVDVDLGEEGDRLLGVSQDRCLRIVDGSPCNVLAQTGWESRREIAPVGGRPQRCAIGRGEV